MIKFRDFLKPSIKHQLLYGVVLISAIATFFSIASVLYVDYVKDRSAALDELSVVKQSFIPTLLKGIWEYNPVITSSQLEGILSLEHITFVKYSSTTGAVEKRGVLGSKDQIHEFKLSYEGEPLGKLEVELDEKRIIIATLRKGLTALIVNIFKTLFVSYWILVFFNYYLTRHVVFFIK